MKPSSFRQRREQSKLWKFRFLSNLSTSLLIVVVGFLLVLIGTVVFFATQIPSPQDLTTRTVAKSTKIYDRKRAFIRYLPESKSDSG